MLPQNLDEKKLWRAVLAELQLTLSELTYRTWLANTRAEKLTPESLDIVCPSQHCKATLEKTCFSLIQESVNKIGQGNYKLNFRVGHVETESAKESESSSPLFSPISSQEAKTPNPKSYEESGLSPRFTFENYVRGNNNQLAYSIAWAVAANPGIHYNPAFIYSGVGLGKTHLLQAIGNKILHDRPTLKVVYSTGESFTNELIEAIRGGKGRGKYTTEQFRKKFRSADVLLLDDIQFISGRESTEQEFFHTFNALHMAQKQIVLTSDRPPKDFTHLEERIKSRFGSGIIADIQTPDIDTRVAILRTKRDLSNDDMPNDVLEIIAQKVDTNIRELEAAYLQVLTAASSAGKPATVEIAAKSLGQTLPDAVQKPVNLNQVLNAVCNYYSLKSPDIKGKRRTKNIVVPRQIAMYLIKDLTNTPLTTIGDFLGGRDHTTIMHGIKKVEEELMETEVVKRDVANVKQLIYQR